MNLPVQIESCVLIVENSEEMLFTPFPGFPLSYTLRNHKITVKQLSRLIRLYDCIGQDPLLIKSTGRYLGQKNALLGS